MTTLTIKENVAAAQLFHAFENTIDNSARLFLSWYRRNQQRQILATLDTSSLNDIGLTLAQVEAECAKPFWKN